MQETAVLITSPIGVLAVLCAVAGFFFFIEQATGAKLFQYVPPLLFIYITPVILSNVAIGGVTAIPNSSIVYLGHEQLAGILAQHAPIRQYVAQVLGKGGFTRAKEARDPYPHPLIRVGWGFGDGS